MNGFETVMTGLTAIYVGVTGWYAVISHKTLKAIEGQGESGAKQLTIAQDSVEALNNQVREMQSARAQTQDLIGQASRQAEGLYSVVGAIKQSLQFSEVTANAALINAMAIIKSDRAQIVCKWRKIGDSIFNLCIENCGKTPAPIVDVDIHTTTPPITESLPEVPRYLDQRVLQARILCAEEKWCDAVGFTVEMSANGFPTLWDNIAHQKIRCWIWGRVRYKDIFNTDEIHETRFCFFYESRINSFIVGGPAGYTQYT